MKWFMELLEGVYYLLIAIAIGWLGLVVIDFFAGLQEVAP